MTLLMRCRDAEMMGPVCDYISDEEPFDDTARKMRVNAQVHNEPEITDDDLADTQEFLAGGESCCPNECCC